jgi:hypothetical protein
VSARTFTTAYAQKESQPDDNCILGWLMLLADFWGYFFFGVFGKMTASIT